MKTILLAAVAAMSLTAGFTAPAMAQPYGPPGVERGGGWDIQRRIQWTEARILRGHDEGAIEGPEFARVQHELKTIREHEEEFRRFHDGRLDDRARAELEASLDRVNDQIHWIRENPEHRPW